MSTQENDSLSKTDHDLSLQQEISDLRLQLNASQQKLASLELTIRQKEEIIIKCQAETLHEHELHQAEVKKLKQQLKEKSQILEDSSTIELQEAVRAAEERERKAIKELAERTQKEQKLNKILEEYEVGLASKTTEYNNLRDLHEQIKGNLATLETAFHDVIQKYERAKAVIDGYETNEKILKNKQEALENNLKRSMEGYDSLKAHAKSQIERANKENTTLKNQVDGSDVRQNAIIKRLEIKIGALENSLEQKDKECTELAALCDEITRKHDVTFTKT